MEGRGVGNTKVFIIFSNNSDEFQAFMQESKSHQVIMTAFLEEMKQQSQYNLEKLREKGQSRQEVAYERQFSNELRGWYSDNLRGASEFHRLPMQAEFRYLPPHKRERGTLENITGERLNAARSIAPQRIFVQTNPNTQFGVYKRSFSFNGSPRGGGGGGDQAATCKSKWQLGTISSLSSSTISSGSLTRTTSSSATFSATHL